MQQAERRCLPALRPMTAAGRESVRTLMVPEHNGHLDLVLLMMQLGRQQVNSIWVEAGPTLAGIVAGRAGGRAYRLYCA